ncbi:unnamed protein product, partial [Rotaria magnacalcarata]
NDELTLPKEPEVPDKSESTTNGTNDEEELKLDLTGFEENS